MAVPPTNKNITQKKAEKGTKIQEYMYRSTMNVEHEMYDQTSNTCSHWNSNIFKNEKFGSNTRKTFNRFTISDSYTSNITHNTESTAVCNSKPEPWGSPLVQEMQYREEKSCHF